MVSFYPPKPRARAFSILSPSLVSEYPNNATKEKIDNRDQDYTLSEENLSFCHYHTSQILGVCSVLPSISLLKSQSCRPNSFLNPENFFFFPEGVLCTVPPLAMLFRSLPLMLRLLSGLIDLFMLGTPSLVVGLLSFEALPLTGAAGKGQFCGVVRLCSLGCLVVGLRGNCESTGDCAT